MATSVTRVSLLTLVALLSLLAAPQPVFGADCSLSSPGTPTDGNDIPQCPCGTAYYSTCAPLQLDCVTCPVEFTSGGCYNNTSPDYADPTTNVRCQCSSDPSGACCQTDGTFSSASTVCQASLGCALASYCTGNATDCPIAAPAPLDAVCSNSTGPCQGDTLCDGVSLSCPSDTPFLSNDTVCANATGPCQHNSKCTGSSATCPPQEYILSGSVCDAALGSCETDAVCDGSSATCPARPLLEFGTTCYNASGSCQTNSTCNGISPQCPAPSFLARGTVCNQAPTTGCFGDGTCPGNSATCGNQPQKAVGADCGTNPLCITAYTNNTCNSIGACAIGQCSSCANGLQGADCTCHSNPPSGGGPYRCRSGMWNTTSRVTSPSVFVYSDSLIYMTSNLTTNSLIFDGTNSTILLAGCATLPQILILLSPEELELIMETPSGITSNLIDLVNNNWRCSTLNDLKVAISGPSSIGCKKVAIKQSPSSEGLFVTFSANDSNCDDPGARSRKWIIIGSVIGVVILFALITAIVIFTFNEKARLCIGSPPKRRSTDGPNSVL